MAWSLCTTYLLYPIVIQIICAEQVQGSAGAMFYPPLEVAIKQLPLDQEIHIVEKVEEIPYYALANLSSQFVD